MLDMFVTDPLLKRTRRMARIEEQLKENTARKRALFFDSVKLTEEYEKLRKEAKYLKKTGKLPSE